MLFAETTEWTIWSAPVQIGFGAVVLLLMGFIGWLVKVVVKALNGSSSVVARNNEVICQMQATEREHRDATGSMYLALLENPCLYNMSAARRREIFAMWNKERERKKQSRNGEQSAEATEAEEIAERVYRQRGIDILNPSQILG